MGAYGRGVRAARSSVAQQPYANGQGAEHSGCRELMSVHARCIGPYIWSESPFWLIPKGGSVGCEGLWKPFEL